jgi:hypothetical protein
MHAHVGLIMQATACNAMHTAVRIEANSFLTTR